MSPHRVSPAGVEVFLALLVRISHAAKVISNNPPMKSVKLEMKRKQGCPGVPPSKWKMVVNPSGE
jgi:hypothetical protein